MIRLGLIGAGRWGRNFIWTVTTLEGVQLTRLASRNPESRKLVAADCIVSSDWRELLDAGDLDGVIIATPPALHGEMASAAVAVGLAALVEKPLVLALDEATALRDLVRARGGLVMVDHTHLYHPAFRELKQQATRLGPIGKIEAEAGNHGPYRPDASVLWDWGPHDVAMCLDLLREFPREVRATRVAHERVGDAEAETVQLDLEYSNGLNACIRISNMMEKTRRFTVHCENGVLVYDDLAQDKLVLRQEVQGAPLQPAGTPITVSPELPLRRVVKAFVKAITESTDRSSSLDLAVEVVAVLERCGKVLAAS